MINFYFSILICKLTSESIRKVGLISCPTKLSNPFQYMQFAVIQLPVGNCFA